MKLPLSVKLKLAASNTFRIIATKPLYTLLAITAAFCMLTIIIWSLNNRWLVIALAVLVAIAGVYSLSSLNFDAFPDTTPVQVQINTPAPALVPEEIERLITFPVELAISGMRGLQQVRSVSQFGASAVIATGHRAITNVILHMPCPYRSSPPLRRSEAGNSVSCLFFMIQSILLCRVLSG